MIETIYSEVITFEDDIKKWNHNSKNLSLDYWYPKPEKIDYPQILEITFDNVKKIYQTNLKKRCWGIFSKNEQTK